MFPLEMKPSAVAIGFLCGLFSGQVQGLNITQVPAGQIYTCSMSAGWETSHSQQTNVHWVVFNKV